MNFKNIKAEIINEYHKDNAVADDDKLLIAKIWCNHGWDNQKNIYENLLSMPSAESIRRTRQKLVESGIIKPSAKATEKRFESYKAYYGEFGSDYEIL